jgi:hypothetical protein
VQTSASLRPFHLPLCSRSKGGDNPQLALATPRLRGVVLVNRALVSLREDLLQVPVSAGYKRRTSLCSRNGEAAVKLGNVVIVEKLVGPFQRSDPAQSQLLGSRPCQVEKFRSERPRACGE